MCAKSIICLSYYQKHVLMHCITSYTTSAVFKKHAPMLCNTKVRDAAVWRYSQMGYLKQEIGHSFRSIPSSGVFLKSILQICNLHTPDFLENFCCIKFLYTGTPNFFPHDIRWTSPCSLYLLQHSCTYKVKTQECRGKVPGSIVCETMDFSTNVNFFKELVYHVYLTCNHRFFAFNK